MDPDMDNQAQLQAFKLEVSNCLSAFRNFTCALVIVIGKHHVYSPW